MANLKPEWVKQFHPTKNGVLSPNDLVPGTSKRIWWLCQTCNYDWEIDGESRLNGDTGCQRCAGTLKKTQAEFETEFTGVHGDKYSLEKAIYVNSNTKIEIICPEHGSWYPIPHMLLRGHGCKRCAETGKNKKSEAEWRIDFAKVHDGKYTYPPFQDKLSKDDIEILCPEHGSFFQQVTNHAEGKGFAPSESRPYHGRLCRRTLWRLARTRT